MNEHPEINLARRVLQKYDLRPPVDIFALVAVYATVDVFKLPLDLDGVSLNLKIPGKHPAVILNAARPLKRKRFTLAHELGHILIPWHIGTILDEIDSSYDVRNLSYWELENEANRFAAELLMPRAWVKGLVDAFPDPCEVLEQVTDIADVSIDAAIIRINQLLDPGYVYAILDHSGIVISSGRSNGTLTDFPEKGLDLAEDTVFFEGGARWESRTRDGILLWWHFPS